MKKLLLGTVLLSAVFTSCKKNDSDSAPAVQESVSGNVSGVWKKGTTYKITGSVSIQAGQSLTIEEGVTVLMSDSVAKPEFLVMGNLYCNGTAAAPIRFTVPDAWKTSANKWGALWGGIIAGPACTEMVLENVELEYGGAVTTEESASVKAGLYKAAAGEPVPALYFANVNGKLVVQHSTIHNFHEDGFYIEGGKVILDHNIFYTTGLDNGDAINLKSGVLADVAFNLVYSPNTNGMKLSNTGDRTPQAYIVGYNNTIVNAGWRRPTTKGGSIWVEKTVHVDLYNNLLTNDRYGIKRDKANPEDNRSIFNNTYYYGYNQTCADQFQPNTEIIQGANDVISATAGDNDPSFENYSLSTDMSNADFNTGWDFHLKAGSAALSKGKTGFTRQFSAGITLNGQTYSSPEPAAYSGAYGTR